MFGRAAIRLGIGPHSSSFLFVPLHFPVCIYVNTGTLWRFHTLLDDAVKDEEPLDRVQKH